MLIGPEFEPSIVYVELQNELQSDTATIVEIGVAVGGRVKTFVGTARRDPHDKPNPNVGYQLALGRALRSAGRALLKEGNQRVHQEQVKRRREQQLVEQRKAEYQQRRAEGLVKRMAEVDQHISTGPIVTKSGKILTDVDIRLLADEAEQGYDVNKLKDKHDY